MVVTDIGYYSLVGCGIILRCFRGGFEQPGQDLGIVIMLDLRVCSLGGRAFSFDSGASGRTNDR